MPIISARFPGTCVLCDSDFPSGETIMRWGSKWAHIACGESEMNKDLINYGESTLRSHKANDWRRKSKRR